MPLSLNYFVPLYIVDVYFCIMGRNCCVGTKSMPFSVPYSKYFNLSSPRSDEVLHFGEVLFLAIVCTTVPAYSTKIEFPVDYQLFVLLWMPASDINRSFDTVFSPESLTVCGQVHKHMRSWNASIENKLHQKSHWRKCITNETHFYCSKAQPHSSNIFHTSLCTLSSLITPYYSGFTLWKDSTDWVDFRVVFKSSLNFCFLLRNSKFNVLQQNIQGVVYKIKCARSSSHIVEKVSTANQRFTKHLSYMYRYNNPKAFIIWNDQKP